MPQPLRSLALLWTGLAAVSALHAQPTPSNLVAIPQPANVLRYEVTFATPQAARGFVEYAYLDGIDSVTARTGSTDPGTTHALTVMGLVPATTYRYRAVAWDATGCYPGAWLTFTTTALPTSVAVGHVQSISGAAGFPRGYVLSNASLGNPDRYLQVHDRRGRLIWYQRMPGIATDQLDGPCQHFSFLPDTRTILSLDCGHATEIALDGSTVRSVDIAALAPGWMPHHDISRLPTGDWLVLAARAETRDLSSVGGDPASLVVGPGLLQVTPAGTLAWSWSAFDHLDTLTSPAPGGDWVGKLGAQARNWLDANSAMRDGDGNFILSLGGPSQVVKVARNTGAPIWTVGPMGSIEVLPPDSFQHQHALRAARPGYYLTLDNAGLGTETRATEWWIDFSYIQPRVHISWSHTLPATDFSPQDGNIDPIPGGGYILGSAGGRSISQITQAGSLIWKATLDSTLYRAYYLDDFYARLHPQFAGDTTICVSDSLVLLQASIAGGIWEGDFVRGDTFDAAAAGAGPHVVTYKLGPESFTVELQVDDAPNCGVGVEDALAQELSFTLHPNPVTAGAPVLLTWQQQRSEHLRLQLVDVQGRLLRDLDLGLTGRGLHHVQLTDLPAGAPLWVVIRRADGSATARRLLSL